MANKEGGESCGPEWAVLAAAEDLVDVDEGDIFLTAARPAADPGLAVLMCSATYLMHSSKGTWRLDGSSAATSALFPTTWRTASGARFSRSSFSQRCMSWKLAASVMS